MTCLNILYMVLFGLKYKKFSGLYGICTLNLLNLITKDTPSALLVIVKYDFPNFDKKVRELLSHTDAKLHVYSKPFFI